jgi:hypothetical protein
MRLSEIYIKEFFLKEFWANVSEELLTEVDTSSVDGLLRKADELIFKKFGILPNNKVYFIAGSARLYLFPKLRDAFGLTGSIGDLDIVIPNKEFWVRAGLENEFNNGGIYRPTEDGSVEAFTIWAPNKAGGIYADVNVRPTSEILVNADLIEGYYYMSLSDVADYKTKLNRDKEQDVVSLINQYNEGTIEDKQSFLRLIVKAIGLTKTKEFFGLINKD